MKKLTKSATDRQVSGVLGGIAEYFGIDSTIRACDLSDCRLCGSRIARIAVYPDGDPDA